jgi:hypothetical protein
MRAYNLFRRREYPALYCAVPEDQPVPTFLSGERWEFACRADKTSAARGGFNLEAAENGARTRGFYLFQAFRLETEHAAAKP